MVRRYPLAGTAIVSILAAGPHASVQPSAERNAYFGETHVHSSGSFDAFLFG
jgi:hypothetical protein